MPWGLSLRLRFPDPAYCPFPCSPEGATITEQHQPKEPKPKPERIVTKGSPQRQTLPV